MSQNSMLSTDFGNESSEQQISQTSILSADSRIEEIERGHGQILREVTKVFGDVMRGDVYKNLSVNALEYVSNH